MNGFEIRRNPVLSAVLGLGAAVMAIAYLSRASDAGTVLDWLICAVMGLIAVVQLVALVDSRTPLLVADQQGVRIRLGQEWLGLPWGTLEQVIVEERDTPVRDGRLVLVPRDIGDALDSLLPGSRRAVAWQRRLHGAPLSVPLSIGTRSTGEAVRTDLVALAAGRTDVVALRGRERASLVEEPAPMAPVAAMRSARDVVRAELVRDPQPRPVATQPVPEPVAIEEPAPVRVADPVIGPLLREARERAGLDVEELSARTMIRPHVLEAMEVDDFGPCGGDFYARGHLRTLARYLALDVQPLLALYDERYSHAPINARRVFEAELATGMGGGMRATVGGPRWSLLVGAVLALLMVWGVARFFTEQPAEVTSPSPVVSDSAGLAANQVPITSPLTRTRTLAVKAIGGHSQVTVRDRTGKVLWSGWLHRGEQHVLAGVAPFTVRAGNAAVIRVRLGATWLGPVGLETAPASRQLG